MIIPRSWVRSDWEKAGISIAQLKKDGSMECAMTSVTGCDDEDKWLLQVPRQL